MVGIVWTFQGKKHIVWTYNYHFPGKLPYQQATWTFLENWINKNWREDHQQPPSIFTHTHVPADVPYLILGRQKVPMIVAGTTLTTLIHCDINGIEYHRIPTACANGITQIHPALSIWFAGYISPEPATRFDKSKGPRALRIFIICAIAHRIHVCYIW